jgi:hypothetical protein
MKAKRGPIILELFVHSAVNEEKVAGIQTRFDERHGGPVLLGWTGVSEEGDLARHNPRGAGSEDGYAQTALVRLAVDKRRQKQTGALAEQQRHTGQGEQ